MNVDTATRRRAGRGITLLEVLIVCAVVGVISAVALPGYRGWLMRAGRADAVEALTRLQIAQSRHHAAHGMYAGEMTALRGVPHPTSTQGLYLIGVVAWGDGYRATAAAVPGGRQVADTECPILTVAVANGFTHTGPSARCWSR